MYMHMYEPRCHREVRIVWCAASNHAKHVHVDISSTYLHNLLCARHPQTYTSLNVDIGYFN